MSRYTIHILAILFSISLYSQDYDAGSPYLKVSVSNTEPDLNEIITITADCTSPYDFDDATIFFHFYQSGIEILSGEKSWSGKLVKGQRIVKQMTIRCTERKVFYPAVYFTGQLSKVIKIYVAGAFEEDIRVRKMRAAIEWYKQELIASHNHPFEPDTTVYTDSADDNFPKLLPKEITLKDIEQKKKNDSLLHELRREYDLVKKQVEKRRLQDKRGKNKHQR